MIYALVILGWLVCGVLAFGMFRHDTLAVVTSWEPIDTVLNYLLFAMGPLGLFVALIASAHSYGLRFTIPDDVREPRVKP